jgi:hypothetical protein
MLGSGRIFSIAALIYRASGVQHHFMMMPPFAARHSHFYLPAGFIAPGLNLNL